METHYRSLSQNALRLLILALALVTVPLVTRLPQWVVWENGPVENAQAIVLLFGAIVAGLSAARARTREARAFWLAAAPLWLIFFGRELSWGAVFLTPLDMTPEGPVFSSHALFYKPVVHPAVGLLIAFSLYQLFVRRGIRLLANVHRSGRFPFFELVVAAIGFIVSTATEGHAHLSLPLTAGPAQIAEECAELVAYLALLSGQWRLLGHAAPQTA
ncbi:hypothetical protein [Chitinasiproducens palmae]|uniref:hypothetical protein n=1 Tax=Chitinasiproducens palmae TaxID=1770053 RepID=UPI001113D214|nr:hypothetical protein [Chitinasiproducens palmae]